MKKDIVIRLARPSDARNMAEVGMRSWEVAYKGIMPEEYIREKNATRPAQFAQNITDENTYAYVAQYNGKTVGIMRIAPPVDDDVCENTYEIHYIYLHPDYFRMGIGTEMMEFAYDIARGLGKAIMVVWVLAENVDSIRFYEKCGFVADGKSQMTERGRMLEQIRMRKCL